MPYRYLDDVATADVAFEANGASIEKMFVAAAEATMNIIVEDLASIIAKEEKVFSVEDNNLEILLFKFLQELIYFKDAHNLLLRIKDIQIFQKDNHWILQVHAEADLLDPARHHPQVDIKAITLHRLSVKETPTGWISTVVVDI